MLLALVQFPIVVWVGPTAVAQVILALAAGAFTIYGVSFGQAIRARRLTRGTVLDVTVTYTIAVLLCVGAVSITEGAVITPIPQPAVGGAVNVLLVMIGTFLVSLIIRLKRSADAADSGTRQGHQS
jgi:Na+/phosphate symporter